MRFRVREALPDDVQGVRELIGQHWRVNLDYAKELKNRDAVFLVADSRVSSRPDGRPLGVALMWVTRWNRTGYLAEIAVDRAHRRKGVGSEMLTEIARRARARRLRAIIVETQPDSRAAVAFYLHSGLRFCGYNDRYYTNKPRSPHQIAIFFSLDL